MRSESWNSQAKLVAACARDAADSRPQEYGRLIADLPSECPRRITSLWIGTTTKVRVTVVPLSLLKRMIFLSAVNIRGSARESDGTPNFIGFLKRHLPRVTSGSASEIVSSSMFMGSSRKIASRGQRSAETAVIPSQACSPGSESNCWTSLITLRVGLQPPPGTPPLDNRMARRELSNTSNLKGCFRSEPLAASPERQEPKGNSPHFSDEIRIAGFYRPGRRTLEIRRTARNHETHACLDFIEFLRRALL